MVPPPKAGRGRRYTSQEVANMAMAKWRVFGSQEELFVRGEGQDHGGGDVDNDDIDSEDSPQSASESSGKLFALFILIWFYFLKRHMTLLAQQLRTICDCVSYAPFVQ